MIQNVTGSCLCKQVRFEITCGPETWMEHCHCSMCRKAHGASFATWIDILTENFRLLAGDTNLARYESSKDWMRMFCKNCGSQLFGQRTGSDWISIAAGVLDADPGCRPAANIWVGSKAPWVELLPQYDAKGPKSNN